MDDGLWCRMVPLRLHARALGARRPPTGPLLLDASVLDGALWSAGFFRVDPSIRHCLVAVTPMLTGIAAPSRLDGSACRLWDDAQSAGFGGGITIPLRFPGSALADSRWSPGWSVRSSSHGTEPREVGDVGRACHRPTVSYARRASIQTAAVKSTRTGAWPGSPSACATIVLPKGLGSAARPLNFIWPMRGAS